MSSSLRVLVLGAEDQLGRELQRSFSGLGEILPALGKWSILMIMNRCAGLAAKLRQTSFGVTDACIDLPDSALLHPSEAESVSCLAVLFDFGSIFRTG